MAAHAAAPVTSPAASPSFAGRPRRRRQRQRCQAGASTAAAQAAPAGAAVQFTNCRRRPRPRAPPTGADDERPAAMATTPAAAYARPRALCDGVCRGSRGLNLPLMTFKGKSVKIHLKFEIA